jgi:hypothetical protein
MSKKNKQMENFGNKFLITMAVLITSIVPVGCKSAKHKAGITTRNPIEVVETSQGFAITEGKAKVMFYQREHKSLNGKYSRANYIHPLYGLDGEVLTEDFPADHLHHRGIFWAWHQVWLGDKRVGDP